MGLGMHYSLGVAGCLDSTAANDSTKYGMTASFKPATLILPTHTTRATPQRYVQHNKWEECGPSKIGMDATLTSHYPAGRCGGPWPWPGIGPLWHTQQAEATQYKPQRCATGAR